MYMGSDRQLNLAEVFSHDTDSVLRVLLSCFLHNVRDDNN